MKHTRTVLITGVSTGIGKSFVQLAGTQLSNYRIIAFTKHKLDYDLPANAELHVVDLTNHDAVTKLFQQVVKKYGAIDVLINNAGNGWRGMIEDTSIAEAKEQLDLNVWALVHLTQLVLPGMRAQKSGHIINVTSVATTIDYATIGYYSATKAFLEKISHVLAIETKPWNIHVSLLAPGAVRTKFGHNMINIKTYGTGDYANDYKLWGDRFETMFQKPLTSDQAAAKLVRLVDAPKPYSFLTFRDAFYCYAKKLLPRRVFNTLLLKRYMHL